MEAEDPRPDRFDDFSRLVTQEVGFPGGRVGDLVDPDGDLGGIIRRLRVPFVREACDGAVDVGLRRGAGKI